MANCYFYFVEINCLLCVKNVWAIPYFNLWKREFCNVLEELNIVPLRPWHSPFHIITQMIPKNTFLILSQPHLFPSRQTMATLVQFRKVKYFRLLIWNPWWFDYERKKYRSSISFSQWEINISPNTIAQCISIGNVEVSEIHCPRVRSFHWL